MAGALAGRRPSDADDLCRRWSKFVAAGGHYRLGAKLGDAIVAFALPE